MEEEEEKIIKIVHFHELCLQLKPNLIIEIRWYEEDVTSTYTKEESHVLEPAAHGMGAPRGNVRRHKQLIDAILTLNLS